MSNFFDSPIEGVFTVSPLDICTMTGQLRTAIEPNEHQESRISRDDHVRYAYLYRQRFDVLALIKQLNQLSKSIQRHRGMSMALLGGSSVFQGDFEILQSKIRQRLVMLDAYASEVPSLFGEREKQNIDNAWRTIGDDWQGDDVIDNFELHSHFIVELQTMMAKLASLLERPVSIVVAGECGIELPGQESVPYPNMFKQIELLNFAAKQAPAMVEQLGRIRALATFAAAKGQCDSLQERKLRYEISCMRASNEKLRLQAERLEGVLGGALSSLSLVKTYELKLMFLLNTVEMDVLSGAAITSTSHQIFKLATEIIDVYLTVVDDSFDLVARWHEEDMESWVNLAVVPTA